MHTHGVHIHERDMGSWAAEWIAIPQAFILASGVIHHPQHIAEGLTVNPDRMAVNLELTQGQIMAESIMMRLAVHVGHEPAHEIVADATRRASAQHVDLSTIIMDDERVVAVMARKDIEAVLNPRVYLGECEPIVDAVTSETGKLGMASP